MARKRFTADERDTFTDGAQVVYRNGAHDHNAVVVGEPYRVDGWDAVTVRIVSGKGSVSRGETFPASPGKVTFGWV